MFIARMVCFGPLKFTNLYQCIMLCAYLPGSDVAPHEGYADRLGRGESSASDDEAAIPEVGADDSELCDRDLAELDDLFEEVVAARHMSDLGGANVAGTGCGDNVEVDFSEPAVQTSKGPEEIPVVEVTTGPASTVDDLPLGQTMVGGSASSSSGAHADVPSHVEDVEAAAWKSDGCVAFPGGYVQYYHKLDQFVAYCTHEAHGRCVLTRSSVAGSRRGQGRPLGLLCAWLEMGTTESCQTKADHMNRKRWPDHSARVAARNRILSEHGGNELLSSERPPTEGEGDEPLVMA